MPLIDVLTSPVKSDQHSRAHPSLNKLYVTLLKLIIPCFKCINCFQSQGAVGFNLVHLSALYDIQITQ